jgi:uncharacterized membrane protein (UPF0127 family)
MRQRVEYRDGHGTLTVEGSGSRVPLELAASRRTRNRGLLGRDGIEGALLLTAVSSVHTFGMRFPIEVAFLDRDLRVLAACAMPPNRLALPRLRARHVLEAGSGSWARWGVERGVVLRIAFASGAVDPS